jgi:hypothetical protein
MRKILSIVLGLTLAFTATVFAVDLEYTANSLKTEGLESTGNISYTQEYANGSISTTATIDWTNGNKQSATLGAVTTISFTAPSGRGNLILVATNFGAYTPTWPGTVKWPGGTEPTWTAAGIDIIAFYYDGTNYYGVASLDFQ